MTIAPRALAGDGSGRISVFLPLCLTVFSIYAVLGLSMAALPAYLHATLDFGNVVVGLAIGAQSLAALLSRHFAGTTADLRGARFAVVLGAAVCALAGAIALAATTASPAVALGVLVVSRLVLGLGESFIITGCLS